MPTRRAILASAATGAAFIGAAAATDIAVATTRDAGAPAPAATDAKGRLLWANWSGNQTAYPAARVAPASEDDLAATLRGGATPLRVVGAGHSFTALVPTEGTLISLDGFTGITGHDDTALTATIRTGTRLGALGPALAAIGQEMLTLPDINKQALGGALGTATHGTGETLQAIHGCVRRLRLVSARGEVIEASPTQNADIFYAAVVGLGAFGVITEVTLQNRKLTRIKKRVVAMPTRDALEAWPALKKQHRNCELYIVPFTDMTAVITGDASDEPVKPRGPDTDTDALMQMKMLRDVFWALPALRKFVGRKAFATLPPSEDIDDGWKLLSNERPVRFNEMEFHLPAEAQPAAALEVLAAVEKYRPDVFFPFELRAIAPDNAWLSPFHGRASGSIAVHAYYKNEYRFLFDIVEPIFRRYGGRPHWGKLNSLGAADFASLYPRFKDAAALRKQLDPDGRLLNPYLRKVFGDV